MNDASLDSWFEAIRRFTKPLVEDPVDEDEGETLELFTETALEASGSHLAALYLPAVGGYWICEAASGVTSEGQPGFTMIGTPFDLDPARRLLLSEGRALPHGLSLYIPLKIQGAVEGCLVLTRRPEDLPFSEEEQLRGSAFGMQGALALDLIGSRQAHDLAVLFEERERISRDLHDLGIQHLFATGMLLQRLKHDVGTGLSPRKTEAGLQEAMERLDEAVRQIRNIVYRLRDDDEAMGLVDAVEREASVARAHLGFAPTITFEDNGNLLRPGSEPMARFRVEVADRVSEAITEDIVAVIRESLTNIARHAGAHSAHVTISLYGSGPTGEIQVLVVDDGAGVDPSQTRSSGMANMNRRAVNHGGSFAFSSGPRGRGTSLVWRCPLV
ncbi:sensor histidine kinase [Actinomyces minihominis]|uniref:sensor histidine kinase n=1 Tax=Actinomyces minihominis TaxID=2002838 RepID=UPI000C08D59E|nr:histidine kinase [Actinomyces minihominis]